jgi:hypothetical protein
MTIYGRVFQGSTILALQVTGYQLVANGFQKGTMISLVVMLQGPLEVLLSLQLVVSVTTVMLYLRV